MRKQNRSGLNVGASSLLVIFVLLCLVTFSVLSLVSANADRKLSEKTAQHTTEYYTASNRAEEYLKQIDDALLALYQSAESKEEYFARLPALSSSLEVPGLTWEEDRLGYAVPVSEKQLLRVTLAVLYPEAEGDAFYRVLSWKLEAAAPWEETDSLPLYGRDS